MILLQFRNLATSTLLFNTVVGLRSPIPYMSSSGLVQRKIRNGLFFDLSNITMLIEKQNKVSFTWFYLGLQ